MRNRKRRGKERRKRMRRNRDGTKSREGGRKGGESLCSLPNTRKFHEIYLHPKLPKKKRKATKKLLSVIG